MVKKESITGVTAIKIKNLIKKNLSDRQLFRELKSILNEYESFKESNRNDYVKRLELEVKDYRTLRKLLK